MSRSKTVFIPRLMDQSQLNPQNKNAQALLSQWQLKHFHARSLYYYAPNPHIANNPKIAIHKLWRWRLWLIDLFQQYLRKADLIFYPGGHKADFLGMACRRILGKQVPIISTIEGLIGNQEYEKEYTKWAKHPVYCQHVSTEALSRWDTIFKESAHIIAISPFLANMGKQRYGDKFSVLPLGIDTTIFFSVPKKNISKRQRVISVGRVEPHKRPEIMLDIAKTHPNADFIWIGEGSLRNQLIHDAKQAHINNIQFIGARSPLQLAETLRQADIFIMPSKSEGVPKVTQEAAACGLAQVIFGFYEAPSVIDQYNGFVVWDDQQFIYAVSTLIDSPQLTRQLGDKGAQLAKEKWDWNIVAPQWETTINKFLDQ